MKNKKNNGKRKNVAVLMPAHERLTMLSRLTGISMTKLVDMAVVQLLKDPPMIGKSSEIKSI